ncbi:MAG: ABC transporter ATP-binding protein [Candidatus Dormibacteria bacterium]
MTAIVATGLGMRYGKRIALRDCSMEIASGTVTALIGPNGAGKTTLLLLAGGLLAPTAGTITVLDQTPHRDVELISRIGFVAQDVPLYGTFTVAEMLRFGQRMNHRWDQQLAQQRMEKLQIPLNQRVHELSGGQRAQVSLALALGKRPEILLLDEPLASLDPLARREFMRVVMETAADSKITIVLSSHLVADLERVCDHVVVLSSSRTQVVGEIGALLDSHRVLVGSHCDSGEIDIAGVASIVERTDSERQTSLLVRTNGPIRDSAWTSTPVTLEDLVLAYLARPGATALPAPRALTQASAS